MENWKGILIELVKRLTPSLAFSALLILVAISLRDQISQYYQAFLYLLAIASILINAIVVMEKNRQHQLLGMLTNDVANSVLISGTQNQVTYIVNQYAKDNPEILRDGLEKELRDYLDWVQESFSMIVLRGIEQEGRQVVSLPLESVYVPLNAEYTPDELLEETDSGYRIDNENIVSQRTNSPVQPTILLNQILKLGSRLLIIGGPGSGKSVVLQHMAWTLTVALQSGEPKIAQDRLGLSWPLPLPIYVPLSLYARHLRELPKSALGDQKSLATFISDYLLERHAHLRLNPDFLSYILRDEKYVLLLLDGLDEVPSESERNRVRQAIEDLVSGRKNLRVVVTCRTVADRGQAMLGRKFKRIRVMPLSEELIQALVQRAYKAIYVHSAKMAEMKAKDLLDSIKELENQRHHETDKELDTFVSVPPLITTPLMVRMLLIVHFNNRKLPDQRADLYQKAVDAMLRPDFALDENVADEIASRIGGSLPMNRDMFQYLAYNMHVQGEKQGREIDEKDLRLILAKEPTYRPYIDELIAQTRQRTTLMEEHSGLYSFIHLSFQEFLTGRYLAQNYDTDGIVSLLQAGLIKESWWREPILLLIGYLDITAPLQARRLLIRLAGIDGGRSKSEPLHPDVEIAGAELVATALLECQNQASDLREQLQYRIRDLLWQQRKHAFPSPVLRVNASDAIDRLGYLPNDLYSFIPIPSAEKTRFFIAKYPVTNAQYARFLNADDFGDPELWKNFYKFDENSDLMNKNRGDEGWDWLQKNIDENKKKYPRYWNDLRLGIFRSGVPVVGVTWYEANAYCKWLLRQWQCDIDAFNKTTHIPIYASSLDLRLPTEREWVFAASGDEPEDRFPWDTSGEVTKDINEILFRSNVKESEINRTTPVWIYPFGASAFDVRDMSGNVWEWQANYSDNSRKFIAIRGGSWYDQSNFARLPVRHYDDANNAWNYTGFRILAISRDI